MMKTSVRSSGVVDLACATEATRLPSGATATIADRRRFAHQRARRGSVDRQLPELPVPIAGQRGVQAGAVGRPAPARQARPAQVNSDAALAAAAGQQRRSIICVSHQHRVGDRATSRRGEWERAMRPPGCSASKRRLAGGDAAARRPPRATMVASAVAVAIDVVADRRAGCRR